MHICKDEEKKLLFREIYEEYYEKVQAYIRTRIDDWDSVEDLTEDVFVRCYKNLDRYDPKKAKLSTWIFVITKNLLKNYYRDRKDVLLSEDMSVYDPGEDVDFDRAMHLEEIKQCLNEQLMKLSEQQRSILEMRFYHEMKTEEIAEKMGITDGNVRVILSRTLKKLRGEMDDNVIEVRF